MYINIDFLHILNPFWYLFHLFSVTLLAIKHPKMPRVFSGTPPPSKEDEKSTQKSLDNIYKI